MSRRLPSATPRQVIAALERAGFSRHRVKGGHYQFVHPDHPALLAMPETRYLTCAILRIL